MSENEIKEKIDIRQFNNDWALALMNSGVIVRLHINAWGGTASLDLNKLGIYINDEDTRIFFKKYIRLGSFKIIPIKYESKINGIQAKIRENIYSNSFNTLWGNFIPYTSFNIWHEEHEKSKVEFYDCVKEIISNHDNIIFEIQEEYKKMAKDVWKRVHPDSPDAPENFIINFVGEIISKIPPVEKLASYYNINTVYYNISLPSFLEEDIEKIKDIRRNSELKDYQNELEKNARKKINE